MRNRDAGRQSPDQCEIAAAQALFRRYHTDPVFRAGVAAAALQQLSEQDKAKLHGLFCDRKRTSSEEGAA
jgi:hypothetical protein